MNTALHRLVPTALVLAGLLAVAASGVSGAVVSIRLFPLPPIAAASAIPEPSAPPDATIPGTTGEIIQLGRNVRMPRAVFESLSPEERMVLLRGVGEAERSASLRQTLVAGVFVVAVIAAVFLMYAGERRRLETVRLLAQRGEPLPENLASVLAHSDAGTEDLFGFRAGNRLGNIVGALIQRAADGADVEAFGELVRRHQSHVRHFLRRLCRGDWHRADDLAQEVFR